MGDLFIPRSEPQWGSYSNIEYLLWPPCAGHWAQVTPGWVGETDQTATSGQGFLLCCDHLKECAGLMLGFHPAAPCTFGPVHRWTQASQGMWP